MEKLTDILRRLHEAKVEFSLIGGLAAVHYGASFSTIDIDVCARFSPENLRRIESAVKDWHPFYRMTLNRQPMELTDELIRSLKNLYLGTDRGVLDCLSEIAGVGGFDDVIRRSQLQRFPFGQFYVLKLDALIDSKLAMGGAKDKLVAAQLIAIKNKPQQQELL